MHSDEYSFNSNNMPARNKHSMSALSRFFCTEEVFANRIESDDCRVVCVCETLSKYRSNWSYARSELIFELNFYWVYMLAHNFVSASSFLVSSVSRKSTVAFQIKYEWNLEHCYSALIIINSKMHCALGKINRWQMYMSILSRHASYLSKVGFSRAIQLANILMRRSTHTRAQW